MHQNKWRCVLELIRLLQPGCICSNSDMSLGPSSGNATGTAAPTQLKSESPQSRVVLLGTFLPKVPEKLGGGMLVDLDHSHDGDCFKCVIA